MALREHARDLERPSRVSVLEWTTAAPLRVDTLNVFNTEGGALTISLPLASKFSGCFVEVARVGSNTLTVVTEDEFGGGASSVTVSRFTRFRSDGRRWWY
jgi:hypothetical protein